MLQTFDGLVFVCVQSDTGDATAVYSNLVERYSTSTATATHLPATDIKQDILTLHLDDSWKKSNLEFLNSWTTRVLDLDPFLVQPATDSQKRI